MGALPPSIDTLTGAFTFSGAGVSHTGNAYTFNGTSYAGVTSNGANGLTITGEPGAPTDADTVGARNNGLNALAQANPYCQVLNVTPDATSLYTSTEYKCENFIYWEDNNPNLAENLSWVNETGPDNFGTCNSKYAVDSVNGSDSNAGTCAAPFKTIAKLNTVTFVAGDSIGFAANSRWREEGFFPSSTVANLTLSAYGKGTRPYIDGSLDIPNANFTLNGGDTYTYTATYAITPFTVGTLGHVGERDAACV